MTAGKQLDNLQKNTHLNNSNSLTEPTRAFPVFASINATRRKTWPAARKPSSWK
jgi:hypothetical protein